MNLESKRKKLNMELKPKKIRKVQKTFQIRPCIFTLLETISKKEKIPKQVLLEMMIAAAAKNLKVITEKQYSVLEAQEQWGDL